MKEKKKIPWGLLYVLLTLIILIVFGLANTEFVGLISVIAHLSLGFVALAVLLTGVFLVMEGEIIRLLLHCQGERVSFWTTLKIGLIGIYYSYITPSSTGGQPAQILYLLRDKVSAGNSAAVLFVKFFAYQFSFVLCSILSLVYMYPVLKAESSNLIPIILLGIGINGLWIIVIPLLFCAPVLHGLCGLAVRLLEKCRFLKKRALFIGKVRTFESDFTSYALKFRSKMRYVLLAVLLSVPQVILQMSVLYVVFRAFACDVPYPELLCMQTMLQASVCFVPLPGASGAQEFGFTMFFKSYFASTDVLYTAVLVWRFFTYYLIVILGALLVVFDQLLYNRRHRRSTIES
ncbi:MAG: YbhN family protein [Hominenteromicrobium sp.]